MDRFSNSIKEMLCHLQEFGKLSLADDILPILQKNYMFYGGEDGIAEEMQEAVAVAERRAMCVAGSIEAVPVLELRNGILSLVDVLYKPTEMN